MCWVEHALTRNCGGVGTTAAIAQVRGGRESLACVHASWKREDLPMNRQGQTTERVMKIRKITLGLPNANLRHCVSPSDFDVGADVEQGRSSLYF